MGSHLRIENVSVALATFLLGIGLVRFISSEPVSHSAETTPREVLIKVVTCVPANSGPWRYHGERENLLHDRIRSTELELLKEPGLSSRMTGHERRAERERLMERLRKLRAELRKLYRKEFEDFDNSTKLVYRETCHEN